MECKVWLGGCLGFWDQFQICRVGMHRFPMMRGVFGGGVAIALAVNFWQRPIVVSDSLCVELDL